MRVFQLDQRPPWEAPRAPFDRQLVEVYKRVPQKAFDDDRKIWHFPLHSWQVFKDIINGAGLGLAIVGKAQRLPVVRLCWPRYF